MQYIENRTFDEIRIGDTANCIHTLTKRDILLFSYISGDANPLHLSEEYAKKGRFHQVVAHGMWEGSLISSVLGNKLPGPGTIYLSQSLTFHRPVVIGDTVTTAVTVVDKFHKKQAVMLYCRCVNQRDEKVVSGLAEVVAPTEKIKRNCLQLPEFDIEELF